MEEKVKIGFQSVCLIIAIFLLSCGVKGDPENLKLKLIFMKIIF